MMEPDAIAWKPLHTQPVEIANSKRKIVTSEVRTILSYRTKDSKRGGSNNDYQVDILQYKIYSKIS